MKTVAETPFELAPGAPEGEERLQMSKLEERAFGEKKKKGQQRDCHVWRTTGSGWWDEVEDRATRYEMKATGGMTAGPLSFTVHGGKKSFLEIAEDSDALILSAYFHEKRKRYKKLKEGWNHWLLPLKPYLKWYDTDIRRNTERRDALRNKGIQDRKGDGKRLCKLLGPPFSKKKMRGRFATWAREAHSDAAAKAQARVARDTPRRR